MTLNKSIRHSHNLHAQLVLHKYIEYQISYSPDLEPYHFFWFTITPDKPSGGWVSFQQEFPKLVSPFYWSICENTIGKRYDRKSRLHLKPFLYATPDYENSNEASPQSYSQFNHIHGLIALKGDQLKKFKSILMPDAAGWTYPFSLPDIRTVTIGQIEDNLEALCTYIDYMNKNTSRLHFNENPSMFLPQHEQFRSYLKTNVKDDWERRINWSKQNVH